MTTQITLAISPQEAMQALKGDVSWRFGWHFQASGTDDEPHFVMGKMITYRHISKRLFSTDAIFQIMGHFSPIEHGGASLEYQMKLQPDVPLFHAAWNTVWLVLITIALSSAPHGPDWVPFVLGVVIIGYVFFMFLRYHWHMHEVQKVMDAFIQRTAL